MLIEGRRSMDDDEPFLMSVGGVLDQRCLSGPIDQSRLEDLQLWSVLYALGRNGAGRHPLGVRPARPNEDPPDRWISHGGSEWGTELTELTLQDVRGDLSIVRQFGRQLEKRLRDGGQRFAHLRGRVVALSKHHEESIPRDFKPLLHDLEQILTEDRGYFGQGLDLSNDLPDKLNGRGSYGDHGPFFGINVNAAPGGNEITVAPTSQIQVFSTDAIKALTRRIAVKDKPGNEILIVTCRLPDNAGYVCPSDHSIFQLLFATVQAGKKILPTKPLNIRGIAIHLWDTPNLILWGEQGDFPWDDSRGVRVATRE